MFSFNQLASEVVLEEQTSQGLVDTGPMSLFRLVLSFEKRGHLDLKITGHAIDRPANVRRGEAPDCVTVTHQSHSVFKPNAVQARNVKGTNVAGLIGNKCLAASQYLTMVWRFLGFCLWSFWFCFKAFVVGLFLDMGFALQPHSQE